MEHYELLSQLAKRAGVSPASMLYAFIEETLDSAVEDADFQKDWVEVGSERGEIPEAHQFFARLISSPAE